jgi:hypothetical protein
MNNLELETSQEKTDIYIKLEQITHQLSEILSIVQVFKGIEFIDTSFLQQQLLDIKQQLGEAKQERLQIKSQQNELKEQLNQYLQDSLKEIITQLNQPLQNQILELQNQLSTEIKNEIQLHFESVSSEMRSQINIVREKLEKVQPETTLSPQQESLISAQSIDYTYLKTLLASGDWYEADRETKKVMILMYASEDQDNLKQENLQKFPCEDLQIIDKLWLKYSQGHFGFSIQKRIFITLGGKINYNDYDYEVYCRFGESVGWLVNNCWLANSDLKFSLNAPQGHLPVSPFIPLLRGLRSRTLYFREFFSRLNSCQL